MEKQRKYDRVLEGVRSVLEGERDPVVWMSTVACLLKEEFGFLWVGFYRVAADGLAVGPYQGSLGCLRIELGRGVCGACASKGETVVVENVHQFPGHIACDPRSNSEIVVPVFDQDGSLRAVLDVDSTEPSAFNQLDRRNLEAIVSRMQGIGWKEES